jgi:predicted lipid carrier protein YhbT
MPEESASSERQQSARAFLTAFAERLRQTRSLKQGAVVFHLTDVGGDFCLDCSPGNATLRMGMSRSTPMIEVMGDSNRIQAILEGTKDARAQFLAGGFRVRGDLRYLSDLAMELGILEAPL